MRFTWVDAVIIAGGVIITTVAVAAAMAKVAPPIVPPIPPIPPIPPVPGIPAVVEFVDYPTSLSQLYGFYYTMASPISPEVLQVKALTSFAGPPYPEGFVTNYATLRVLDAAGRGVPNVAVLVWSVPTRDDQAGILSIAGSERPEIEALRVLTDSNGEARIWLVYDVFSNIKILEDRLGFGCCVPWGRAQDIDVGDNCDLPPPLAWICYRQRDARTDLKVYTVNVRIEGTVKSSLFALSCQAIGKALW